ncbi:MAG: cytochrome c-type biogenesis CcmF C-terminal domain-containing protein [Thermoguttaceae bacterium]
MTVFGQLTLLFAFVAAGYSAFACAVGWRFEHRLMRRSSYVSAFASVGALSILMLILMHALAHRDFRFAYVVQNSNRTLPWYYAISALWVGQAGSLLLWSWFLGVAALLYRFWPRKQIEITQDLTFGVLLTYLGFLAAVMVFAADPMEPSLSIPREGLGMSPLLQHPAMLVHPPVIFLGYAIWAVPFALALSALLTGRIDRRWFEQARPWALCAWTILGLGILLGAKWAYDEFGWGGYWNWDPVENASLMPWLTGTALIHCGLAWHYRGLLKRATLLLAVVTFALCNFAAFLTRSGLFGSLHEFSQSPIGWMFLLLMGMITIVAAVLIPLRRKALAADNQISGIFSRESFVTIATIGWLGLTIVVFLGTVAVPLSGMLFTRSITVGPAFYNYALMPVGIVLILTTAAAPALRWGAAVKPGQRKALFIALLIAVLIVLVAAALGMRRSLVLAVTGLATFALVVFLAALFLDGTSVTTFSHWKKVFTVLRVHRRRYAGFAVHLGFVAIAVGVTASSLCARRWETTMRRGDTVAWAGRSIHFTALQQQNFPDKLVVKAQLEISTASRRPVTLFPAQHLHLLQNQWSSEVAIDSSVSGDFYVILDSGRGDDQIHVTFMENPLMCWIWWGGALVGLSALVGLWPIRATNTLSASSSKAQITEIHNPLAGTPPPHAPLRRHNPAFHNSQHS